MLAFAYGQTGWLLMKCGSGAADNDAFIQSENGVRQGDPLSSLLFSIAMRDVYSAIAKRLQAGCYAFIDDSHGVGRLSECWAGRSYPNFSNRWGCSLTLPNVSSPVSTWQSYGTNLTVMR
jgi:hypothetical protein